MESPNVASLMPHALAQGLDARALRTFNVTTFTAPSNAEN
jgi:hypothetical protein